MHDDKELRREDEQTEAEEKGVAPAEADARFRDDDDVVMIDADALDNEDEPDVLDEIGQLQNEVGHLKDLYLRKLAEFDNYRKRVEREREQLRATAAEALVLELLPVIDNFERALQHAGEVQPPSFKQGVEMISRQLQEVLQRRGVEALDPIGEPFNPEFHDAVHREDDTDAEPGTVIEVMTKGYALGGRLLRPAMVTVAAGKSAGTDAAAETDEDGDEES